MQRAWQKISDELMLAIITITNDTKNGLWFCKICNLERKIQVCNKPIVIIVLHELGFCDVGTCKYA